MSRRYYGSRGGKYSIQTTSFYREWDSPIEARSTIPVNEEPHPEIGEIGKGIQIVPATDVMGNRKVKNFTIKLTAIGNEWPLIGCLIYLPEGTVPGDIGGALNSQSIYEPNQNVITSFVIPATCERDSNGIPFSESYSNAINIFTPLSRNLSSGDMIILLLSTTKDINCGDGVPDPETGLAQDKFSIQGAVTYSIKY